MGDCRHDDLISSCIICKAQPCIKLTGMIGADLVPISLVSSRTHLDRILARGDQHQAMQRAVLERSQMIDVMAADTRG